MKKKTKQEREHKQTNRRGINHPNQKERKKEKQKAVNGVDCYVYRARRKKERKKPYNPTPSKVTIYQNHIPDPHYSQCPALYFHPSPQ